MAEAKDYVWLFACMIAWGIAYWCWYDMRKVQRLRWEELSDPMMRAVCRQRDQLMRERDEARAVAVSLMAELGEANLRAYESGRLWRSKSGGGVN